MVMPSPPCRFWTSAVPGAIAYCTSMGEVTGTTFHSFLEKWPAKLRPPEYGSVAVFFIWRIAPDGVLAHRQQGGRLPVVEVQVVERRALPLLHQQPQRDVERLFAGPADPEVAVARLVHRDQALLEAARLDHQCRASTSSSRSGVGDADASSRLIKRGRDTREFLREGGRLLYPNRSGSTQASQGGRCPPVRKCLACGAVRQSAALLAVMRAAREPRRGPGAARGPGWRARAGRRPRRVWR